jgi:hypothetical protein
MATVLTDQNYVRTETQCNVASEVSNVATSDPQPVKRGRGRPRKYDPSIPRSTIIRQFYKRNKHTILLQHKRSYAEKAKYKYETFQNYLKTMDATAPFNMYRTVAEEIERLQRRIDKVNEVLANSVACKGNMQSTNVQLTQGSTELEA